MAKFVVNIGENRTDVIVDKVDTYNIDANGILSFVRKDNENKLPVYKNWNSISRPARATNIGQEQE